MRIHRIIVVIAIVLAAVPSFSQEKVKMCFQLMNWLERPHAADAMIDIFIHGDAEMIGEAVRSSGGLVKRSLPSIVNARIPVAAIEILAQLPEVQRFEFHNTPVSLMNDSARVKSRIDLVHQGMDPLPEAYQGEGVIMGIVDTGLDPAHPDFQDADGNTRVLKYWDQVMANGPLTPAQYGYGQVWTKAHIDGGQMTSTDNNGHGTSVAGIAAGGGTANGMHAGMAPKADLIIVRNPAGGPNFSSTVVDAVQFIFEEAEALGKPAVVNISLGRQLGSHDGKDAAALMIDDMLMEQGGRVVVAAGGNWNQWDPYHMRTEVDADTSFTWFAYNPSMNFGNGITGGVYFEAWADAADFQNVQYAMGADRHQPVWEFRGRTDFHDAAENLGNVITDTIYGSSGDRIGIANFLLLPRGDQYQLQVWLQQPDSNQYRFRFMSTGSGSFDVWSLEYAGWSQMLPYNWPSSVPVPTVDEFPEMVHYVYPDNFQHLADSWACSPHVITVANYLNELGYTAYDGSWIQGDGDEGAITITSSKGPTRDDRVKPDIAAPGDLTFSPGPLWLMNWLIANEPFKVAVGGMHMRGGGTSAASPHVAGAAALYLQKCPNATHIEVRDAITSTAVTDMFTGVVPNAHWGNGKLDAFAALNTSNLQPFPINVIGNDPFCSGETVTLNTPGDHASYEWSNGETSTSIEYGEADPISVIGFNASFCKAYSDTVQFTVWPLPPAPVITTNASVLTSSEAESYQWYFEGEPVNGWDTQSIEVWQTGEYQVEIADQNGCTSISEPVMLISTGIRENGSGAIMLWPSPARDELNIDLAAQGEVELTVIDAAGRSLIGMSNNGDQRTNIPIGSLSAGTYFLRIDDGKETRMLRFVKAP